MPGSSTTPVSLPSVGAASRVDGGADRADCRSCDAVCCRLTVVLQPEDRVAGHFTTRAAGGLQVMARDEDGWCLALDATRMCCSIYDSRPLVCRRFEMDGPYCREVRAEYRDRRARGIPLVMY